MGKTLSYAKLKKILDAVDSRIKSLLSNYLPLTGGTINVPGASGFRVNNTLQAGSYSSVMFSKRDVPIGGIAANSEDNFLYRVKPGFTAACQIWDSANDGTGSGLDADLLDGLHAAKFTRGETSSIVVPAGEPRWVRIAQSTVTTFSGIISLVNEYAQFAVSGVTIAVHGGYRNSKVASINQIGGLGGFYFRKARIVYPTASSDPYYIEVEVSSNTAGNNKFHVRLANSADLSLLQTYTDGGIPNGYAATEITLVNGMSAPIFSGSLSGNATSAGKLIDSAGEYFNRNKLSELKTEIAAKSSTSDSIKIAGVIIPALIAGKGYEEMMSPLRVITAGAIPEDVKTDTNALWYYRGSPDLRKFDSSGNLVSAGISINFENDTLFFCNGKFFTVAGISEMMEVGVCPLYPYGCTDQDNPLSQDAILWQGSPFPASLDGETRYVDERYYKRLTTADKFRIVGYDNIVFDFRVSARVIDPYTKEALIFCEPIQIGSDRCTAMLEVTPDTWTINISQETNIVSANETNTD